MSDRFIELPDGQRIEVDERGYLLDWQLWSEAVTHCMARSDGIELQDDHWVVIAVLRAYFGEHDIEPPMRALLRRLRAEWNDERGSSRYLYRLFPDGPGTQGCRYAGLPRPVSCV